MDLLENYVRQIQRYKLLDAQQERQLSERIERGDKTAVTELVNANLRLVVNISKKFMKKSGISVMDVIQEGNMGLMAAAAKYHHSFNTRFSTYAYPWILQYMLRYAYNKTSSIALPHRKEEMLRRMTKVNGNFMAQYGREASSEELSEILGISEKEIESLRSFSYSVTSIDIVCSDNSNSTIGDMIPDSRYSPEDIFLKEEEISGLHRMLESLPDKERKVVYYRYNFGCDLHVPTLRELSNRLGVSAETVRQMEIRAVRKIRQYNAS